jgi:hypothetical protein
MDLPVAEADLAVTAESSVPIQTAAEVAAQGAMDKRPHMNSKGEQEGAQYPEAISTLAAEPAAVGTASPSPGHSWGEMTATTHHVPAEAVAVAKAKL